MGDQELFAGGGLVFYIEVQKHTELVMGALQMCLGAAPRRNRKSTVNTPITPDPSISPLDSVVHIQTCSSGTLSGLCASKVQGGGKRLYQSDHQQVTIVQRCLPWARHFPT